jgi:hypothetical protein
MNDFSLLPFFAGWALAHCYHKDTWGSSALMFQDLVFPLNPWA